MYLILLRLLLLLDIKDLTVNILKCIHGKYIKE